MFVKYFDHYPIVEMSQFCSNTENTIRANVNLLGIQISEDPDQGFSRSAEMSGVCIDVWTNTMLMGFTNPACSQHCSCESLGQKGLPTFDQIVVNFVVFLTCWFAFCYETPTSPVPVSVGGAGGWGTVAGVSAAQICEPLSFDLSTIRLHIFY